MADPGTTPPPAPVSDADLWERYVSNGVSKDSATSLVQQRAALSPADTWEHLVSNGVSKDSAKVLAPLGSVGGSPAAPSASVDTSPTSKGEASNVHLANALTFGLGNRAAAALLSMVQKGNLSNYDAIRLAQDAREKQQEQEHPLASAVGTAAGAIGSPLNAVLPGGGAARTALGLGGRLALGGGIAGGVTGAAGTPATGTTGDMVRNGLLGAGVGAATGGLLGPAVAGAQRFLSPAARMAAQMPEDAAFTAARMQQAGRGGIMMGADLVKNPQALVAANPQGAAQLADALSARAKEAPQRVLSDLRSLAQAHAAPGTDPIAEYSAQVKAMNPDASDENIAGLVRMKFGNAPPQVQAGMAGAIKGVNSAWHAGDVTEMNRLVQTLTPQELEMARRTVVNQVIEQLENGGTNKKVAQDLIDGARPNSIAQQKLAFLFGGDKPGFDNMVQRMEVERAMVPGSNAPDHVVEGIRQLAGKLFTHGSPVAAIGAAVPVALHGNPAGAAAMIAGSAIPAAVGAQNARVAGQIAPMMMRQGPDAIQSLIAQLSQSAPGALHPAVQAALAGGAGQLGGRAGLLAPQGQAPGQATGLLGAPVSGP